MAGEYGCASDTCKTAPNWLITHLQPPATMSVCDEDFPVFLIPLLAGELGVDAQKLYDVIKRFTDREAAKEAKASEVTATIANAVADAIDPPPCEHEYTPNEAGTHEWCQKCDSVRPIEQVQQ